MSVDMHKNKYSLLPLFYFIITIVSGLFLLIYNLSTEHKERYVNMNSIILFNRQYLNLTLWLTFN